MKLHKPSLPILAILLTLFGPILGVSYAIIKSRLRGPLGCVPNSPCIDLRGLGDLLVLVIVWYVFSVIGTILAIVSNRKKQAHSKLALVISILALLLPVFIQIIGSIMNRD